MHNDWESLADELEEGLKGEGYGFNMSVKETAEALGISKSTVKRHLSDGVLEAAKIGCRQKFPRKFVARYMARMMS